MDKALKSSDRKGGKWTPERMVKFPARMTEPQEDIGLQERRKEKGNADIG